MMRMLGSTWDTNGIRCWADGTDSLTVFILSWNSRKKQRVWSSFHDARREILASSVAKDLSFETKSIYLTHFTHCREYTTCKLTRELWKAPTPSLITRTSKVFCSRRMAQQVRDTIALNSQKRFCERNATQSLQWHSRRTRYCVNFSTRSSLQDCLTNPVSSHKYQ